MSFRERLVPHVCTLSLINIQVQIYLSRKVKSSLRKEEFIEFIERNVSHE
jgi:hypothetical protein